MKRWTARLVPVFTVIALALAPLQLHAQATPSTQGMNPVPLRIATATAGGVWNPMGAALAGLIARHVPGFAAESFTTGGAIENLKLLASGKADMAFAYDYHITRLVEGRLSAVATGSLPARVVMGLYEQPLHLVTRATAHIAGLPDLRGRQVCTGAPDSGTEEQAGYILRAMGLDWDRDLARERLGLAESAQALVDGRIDAFFWSGALPSETSPTVLVDLAADTKLGLHILPISGDMAEVIIQANPGVFHRTFIRKNEYPGIGGDIETLAVTAVLATMESFPARNLADILATIFQYKAELAGVWKGATNLTAARSLAMLSPETKACLHPASVKVFEDIAAGH